MTSKEITLLASAKLALDYIVRSDAYNDGGVYAIKIANKLEEAILNYTCEHQGELERGICLECGQEVIGADHHPYSGEFERKEQKP